MARVFLYKAGESNRNWPLYEGLGVAGVGGGDWTPSAQAAFQALEANDILICVRSTGGVKGVKASAMFVGIGVVEGEVDDELRKAVEQGVAKSKGPKKMESHPNLKKVKWEAVSAPWTPAPGDRLPGNDFTILQVGEKSPSGGAGTRRTILDFAESLPVALHGRQALLDAANEPGAAAAAGARSRPVPGPRADSSARATSRPWTPVVDQCKVLVELVSEKPTFLIASVGFNESRITGIARLLAALHSFKLELAYAAENKPEVRIPWVQTGLATNPVAAATELEHAMRRAGKEAKSTCRITAEGISLDRANLILAKISGRLSVRQALAWRVEPYCMVLEGVPGTGKTYRLKCLDGAASPGGLIRGEGTGRFAMTMHPATAYEDFVEGLRPGPFEQPIPRFDSPEWSPRTAHFVPDPAVRPAVTDGPNAGPDRRHFFFRNSDKLPDLAQAFSLHDGFFVSVCIEAAHYPRCEFAVLLDELNRCNIPKVMGDLLTTIEGSKRARWRSTASDPSDPTQDGQGYWDIGEAQVVTLPYSGRLFFVPANVYVIGTMNTTDRSIAPMDAALRRRFAFERVWPIGFDPTRTDGTPAARVLEALGCTPTHPVAQSVDAWVAMNRRLQVHGDDAMLGHSYLFDLVRDLGDGEICKAGDEPKIVAHHWNKHIFPQLVDSLLSNDLLDRVFKDTGKDGSDTRSGHSIPELDLGDSALTEWKWALTWRLNGSGLLRVPIIVLAV